ncbi:MAG: arsenosugar biosynthesis radical SAM (seleno)protein ArsS [Gemmatimonadota bacterium]
MIEESGARTARGAASEEEAVKPFAATLEEHGLRLARGRTRILQVNTGLLCNMHCRHCHLDAGPGRKEIMSRETMEEVVAFARRVPLEVADITGGAPEMVPDLPFLVEGLAPLVPRLLLRSNLAALAGTQGDGLLDLCVARRVVLVASFPSTDPSRTDSQRGEGAAEAGVAMLRRLNARGYGVAGTGLELDIVSNPAGASLPAVGAAAERRFRRDLARKWGVTFNRLNSFANVPLGRFRAWLAESGNHRAYLGMLVARFNPCAVDGLMCRTLLTVAWDGSLFDCDFNIAAGHYLGGERIRVSELRDVPPPGTPIATGDHCYACTAGSGFT